MTMPALRTHAGTTPLMWLAMPTLLVTVTAVVYLTSFDGVFLFDDLPHIRDNPRIRQLSPIGAVLSGRRPIVDLTLAINFAAGRLRPWGYHLGNLMIHTLAALTLFGLLRRLLHKTAAVGSGASAARWAALAIALLWAVHPLQTQSVTYVIQRGESLAGLFYLLTLYCLLRGAEVTDSGVVPASRFTFVWYAGSIAACGLGMGAKAIVVTAPIVALLFDRAFLTASFTETLRRRARLYAGLFATWGVLWWCGVASGVLRTSAEVATAGFAFKGITPLEYLLTQPGVLLHYLRLSVWPSPLCLDYGWPVAAGVNAVAWPALVVVPLALGTVWACVRRPVVGFVGVWFFALLLPTSSIVPIKDPAFEHRMYLSLAAAMTLGVVLALRGGRWLTERVGLGASAGVAATLLAIVTASMAVGTARRNAVYHSGFSMWHDVVTKRPFNARAHDNYGAQLFRRRERLSAIREFRHALALDPGDPDARVNLGVALADSGEISAGMKELQTVLRHRPRHANARRNLGLAFLRLGQVDEAIEEFRAAVRVNPLFAEALRDLGAALYQRGQAADAIEQWRMAVTVDPELADAHFNLGVALAQRGDADGAIRALRRATRLVPTDVTARVQLGQVLLERGKAGEAMTVLREALRLDPNHAGAQAALQAARQRYP